MPGDHADRNEQQSTPPHYPLPGGHVFGQPDSRRVHAGGLTPLDRVNILTIQSGLRQAGLEVTVNGIFTANTETAVLDFQELEGIEVTGRVGPLTWVKLKNYLPR